MLHSLPFAFCCLMCFLSVRVCSCVSVFSPVCFMSVSWFVRLSISLSLVSVLGSFQSLCPFPVSVPVSSRLHVCPSCTASFSLSLPPPPPPTLYSSVCLPVCDPVSRVCPAVFPPASLPPPPPPPPRLYTWL